VFCPLSVLFFVIDARGALLWVAIALLALDFTLEMIDVLVEKQSRAKLGGVSSVESAVHVAATGFKAAALTAVLVAKPLSAYAIGHPLLARSVAGLQAPPLMVIGVLFSASSFVGGLAHLLIMRPALEENTSYGLPPLKGT
jgi:hypothetical protein